MIGLARWCRAGTSLVVLCGASVAQSQARASGAGAAISNAPTVRTTGGLVQGVLLPSGVRTFRGLPFSAPPVGQRRWKPPQAAASWTGVRSADRFGNQCMQTRQYADMRFRNAGVSEDCLYLNVWAPSNASNAPVLVYFYGGGFTAGDGSEFRYDGESMAKQGIVTVTLSYRLGIFGFFVHPALTAESTEHAAGNYGLMDQTAALRWVRANVAAFGGDPSRVTIAGESAGSMSVSAQVASPMAKGLFARAIGESGAVFPLGGSTATRDSAEANGVRFATMVGASNLAALRELSATELLDHATRQGAPRFGVVVDGSFLPQSPSEIYAAGMQSRVPLLAGWNSEEASWRGLTPRSPTPDSARAVLQRVFGGNADEAQRHFPSGTDAESVRSLTDLAGDRFIGYGTWRWIESHAASSGQNVYRYFYAHPRPGATGAAHSAEIEYAMGNLGSNPVFPWTADDHRISSVLQGYFVNFVRSGDPNGAGLPAWPQGRRGADGVAQRLRIGPQVTPESEPTARYQFLERALGRSGRP